MKRIATLFLAIIVYAVSILIMINGWGIEPQSWAWIIGGHLVALFITVLSAAVIND